LKKVQELYILEDIRSKLLKYLTSYDCVLTDDGIYIDKYFYQYLKKSSDADDPMEMFELFRTKLIGPLESTKNIIGPILS